MVMPPASVLVLVGGESMDVEVGSGVELRGEAVAKLTRRAMRERGVVFIVERVGYGLWWW